MPDIPPVAVTAAAKAIMEAQNANDEPERFEAALLARAALEAAAPVLERSVRRRMAREVLALAEAERRLMRSGARNVGPYGGAMISLRKIARGEALPEPHELRGGNHA